MPKCAPWHSLRENVHHDNSQCAAARRVAGEQGSVRPTAGSKPLCAECALLDARELLGETGEDAPNGEEAPRAAKP